MNFLNTEIDNYTFNEALQKAEKLILGNEFHYIVTPNVDHIVQLEKNEKFQQAYNASSMTLVDGQPLIWISNYLNRPIKEKISGSDFFPALCELAAEKKYRIFLLGAGEGVAEKAKKNLEKKYSGVIISGVYSPPYGFENDYNEVQKINNMINESNTQILAVGLGAPKQELYLFDRWLKKDLNVNLALGIGATIDFEAGNVKRAPKWMQNNGLEWTFRLFQEPGRLFKRYFNDAKEIIPIIKKYKSGQN